MGNKFLAFEEYENLKMEEEPREKNQSKEVGHQRKILFLSSDHKDKQKINQEEELKSIRNELNDSQMKFEEKSSIKRKEFSRYLDEFSDSNILHLSLHGDKSQGGLLFESEDENKSLITPKQYLSAIEDMKSLEMIYFNSSESGLNMQEFSKQVKANASWKFKKSSDSSFTLESKSPVAFGVQVCKIFYRNERFHIKPTDDMVTKGGFSFPLENFKSEDGWIDL